MRVRASGFGWGPVPHRPLCAAFSWIPPAAFTTPAADSLTCLSAPNEGFLGKNCAAFLFYFFLSFTRFLALFPTAPKPFVILVLAAEQGKSSWRAPA